MTDAVTISRETLEKTLAAVEEVDALIMHQFTGTRPAMTALQYACDNAAARIEALRAALAAQPAEPIYGKYTADMLVQGVLPAPAAVPLQTKTCGAHAVGGLCVLPAGHNMGRADVPANHQAAAVPPIPQVVFNACAELEAEIDVGWSPAARMAVRRLRAGLNMIAAAGDKP